MINKFSIGFIVLFSLGSCANPEKAEKYGKRGNEGVKYYNNFVIFADLSNRIKYNLPSDKFIIGEFINYFNEEVAHVGQRRTAGRDLLRFSRLNNSEKTSCKEGFIDLGSISPLAKRQKYVNGKNVEGNSLKDDLVLLQHGVDCVYDSHNDSGINSLYMLKRRLTSGGLLRSNTIDIKGNIKFAFKNHIVLFTDGYIEFNTKSGDEGYFGGTELKRLRRAYLNSEEEDIKVFLRNNPSYGLPLMKKPFIQDDAVLYILETWDRTADRNKGNGKLNDIGDNELLEAVWYLWAESAGFSGFLWLEHIEEGDIGPGFIKNILVKVEALK
ncbi:MAG: Uncharacterised protein [Bacteroidetes bacterium MED-G17]|nr:MAG: Uncharacterised protein [Bacteroidetes bacterium MED-G17]